MLKIKYQESAKVPSNVVTLTVERSELPPRFQESAGQHKILIMGIKKEERLDDHKLALFIRKIIRVAKNYQIKVLGISLETLSKLAEEGNDLPRLLGLNLELANYDFTEYKTPKKGEYQRVEEIILTGKVGTAFKNELKQGQEIGFYTNYTRDLANTPASDMTPEVLASRVKTTAKELPIKIKVLDEKQIQVEKMGAIWGVAKGSKNGPRFITLEYQGGKTKEAPVVLIGKGVTFDSGGLDIKTSLMAEMYYDMSGAGAVAGTVFLAAKLGIRKNIVALIPAVENMISGNSYRPGDVLKSRSGKTIEVGNTDAEGRLILADALDYAKKYNPSLVIDVATLTGAAMVALGQRASAIFSKDEKLLQTLQHLGSLVGDRVWPLPLWDEYRSDMNSEVADIKNTGKSRYGGAITAAIFLYDFAKELKCPWVHIDIAPRMTSIEEDNLAKGSIGTPVPLLIKFLMDN